MVNSRGRWLTIRAEPTIRSDARLALIVHHALKRPIVGVFD